MSPLVARKADADADYSQWVVRYLDQLTKYEPVEKAAKALTASLKSRPAKKAKAKAKA